MRMHKRAAVSFVAAGLLIGLGLSAAGQDKKPLEKGKANGAAPGVVEAPAPFEAGEMMPTPQYGIPTLNYNYYYPAPSAGQVISEIPARLYLCPRPVPPYVGYTYITYPPMQPHEWLWPHRRAYYRMHPGGGMSMTSIWWKCE